jgi:hypothetical protein
MDFGLNLPQNYFTFINQPKMEIYKVINLRTVNRCNYEALYILPPTKGL